MGAPVTPETPLGRRAEQIRPRAQRMLRRIASAPPKGVILSGGGGKHHLSPLGYFGRRLYLFGKEYERTGAKCPWKTADQATSFLRKFLRGGNGRHAQIDLLTFLLPALEAEFPRIEKQQFPALPPPSRAQRDDPAPAAPEAARELPVAAESVPSDVLALGQIVNLLTGMEDNERRAAVRYIGDRFSE